MTRLEWFESGAATRAVELGVISPSVLAHFIRFKIYQEFREGYKATEAIELTAERCKCNRATVYRSILFVAK